jgi:hypothetical protein
MHETTRQYVDRITGYVRGEDHVQVLQDTVRIIKRLLRNATPKTMNKPPAVHQWSIAQILAHLAESELVLGYRLRMVLGSNGAAIQAFDQNAWQRNAGYLENDPKNAFRLFAILRANNLALLKSLSKQQWDFYGMHQERGRETVRRMVELYAGHDVNHVRQIEGILKATR